LFFGETREMGTGCVLPRQGVKQVDQLPTIGELEDELEGKARN
jgi:hypothetical protein